MKFNMFTTAILAMCEKNDIANLKNFIDFAGGYEAFKLYIDDTTAHNAAYLKAIAQAVDLRSTYHDIAAVF